MSEHVSRVAKIIAGRDAWRAVAVRLSEAVSLLDDTYCDEVGRRKLRDTEWAILDEAREALAAYDALKGDE